MKRLLLWVMLLCSISSGVQAAVVPTEQALQDAANYASDPMFQSVGWLAGTGSTGPTYVAGSGVLIAPQWILTAGHVVDPEYTAGLPSAWASMQFSFSSSILSDPPNYVSADAWFAAPDFSGGYTNAQGSDLGLVHLSQPITSISPAAIFVGAVQLGDEIFAAGYGFPGVAGSGLMPYDGIKRAGTNIIYDDAQYPFGNTSYIFDNFDRPGFPNFTSLEIQGSPGDSGSPWLNSAGQIVGITSFGKDIGGYAFGSITAATRVSLYGNWIDSYVSPVPEPTTVLMMLVAMPFLIATRLERSGSATF